MAHNHKKALSKKPMAVAARCCRKKVKTKGKARAKAVWACVTKALKKGK